MKRSLLFVALAVLVLAVLALGWRFMRQPAPAASEAPAAQTSDLTPGESIYTNGEYGFAFQYPSTASVSDSFSTTYHLGSAWRATAVADSTGSPVVEVLGYSTVSDHSFPRYYHALVRVGASADPAEVARCTKPVSDQGETALPDRAINGTTWKAFGFQSAGMMQYAKGISYRTVHEGKCIALEKIAAGSSYQDDPDSADDVPQATLDAQYAELDRVVDSFSFARP